MGAGEVVVVVELAAAVLVLSMERTDSMSLRVRSGLSGTRTPEDTCLPGEGDMGGVGGEWGPSSSRREAGVRQASSRWDAWQLGGTTGWGEGDEEGGGIICISRADGCDPPADRTPNDGGASRKPSSMGSSGGGEGGSNSGRREPSCLSSSWIRRSMLLMSTRRSRRSSPSGR